MESSSSMRTTSFSGTPFLSDSRGEVWLSSCGRDDSALRAAGAGCGGAAAGREEPALRGAAEDEEEEGAPGTAGSAGRGLPPRGEPIERGEPTGAEGALDMPAAGSPRRGLVVAEEAAAEVLVTATTGVPALLGGVCSSTAAAASGSLGFQLAVFLATARPAGLVGKGGETRGS
jgi:hypothetical protein